MKAITLTQPWAGLVAAGIKLIENRERPIISVARFGEPLAIHASREIDESVYELIADIAPELATWGIRDGKRFPTFDVTAPWYRLSRITSAVIGVSVPRRVVRATVTVDLVDGIGYSYDAKELAEIGEQRRWLFGKFGYVFDAGPRVLPTPVHCKGMLGCWTLPPDVEQRVKEQL
jgi:hypothetical protein